MYTGAQKDQEKLHLTKSKRSLSFKENLIKGKKKSWKTGAKNFFSDNLPGDIQKKVISTPLAKELNI